MSWRMKSVLPDKVGSRLTFLIITAWGAQTTFHSVNFAMKEVKPATFLSLRNAVINIDERNKRLIVIEELGSSKTTGFRT